MTLVINWCVRLLTILAGFLGITYKEINVWIFVIIWPVLTIMLVVLIFVQRSRISKLRKELENLKG